MRPPQRRPAGASQRGAALMVMLVIMVMGIAAMLINSLSATKLKNARQETTAAALAQAKDALIGYAITYGDMPTHSGEVHGYLPCPDNDGVNLEGSAEPSCGSQNVSVLGRLPWKTLGLPALRDGDGECLWYAVSGTYKNNPKTDLMNWDNNGQFQAYAADGTRLDSDNNQVVAVIFSPSTALDNQNRAPDGNAPICGGNYTASAYLDNDTAHGIDNANVNTVASAVSKFIQGGNNGKVNDRTVFITRQDIWNAMLKRSDFTNTLKLLTQRVAECLADYGRHNRDWFNNPNPDNMSLPWPAPLALSDYAVNDNYNDDDNRYAGRVPYRVSTSRSNSNNNMTGSYPYPLMANNGLNCPSPSSANAELRQLYPWWNNWKDHLYYALSYEYRPRVADTGSCTGDCVWTHSLGHRYAAIVIFAGSALTGKDRASTITTNTERGELHRYLERLNLSSYPNSMGNGEYEGGPADSTFNDILYCTDTDLSVVNDCK